MDYWGGGGGGGQKVCWPPLSNYWGGHSLFLKCFSFVNVLLVYKLGHGILFVDCFTFFFFLVTPWIRFQVCILQFKCHMRF